MNTPLRRALCLIGVDGRLCSSKDVCIIVCVRQSRCVQNLLNTKCNLSALCEATTNSDLNEQDVPANFICFILFIHSLSLSTSFRC